MMLISIFVDAVFHVDININILVSSGHPSIAGCLTSDGNSFDSNTKALQHDMMS